MGEEIANSASHGVGLVGALTVTPILIVVASRSVGVIGVVAASVFGATMIFMYLMSTLYHALPESRAKRVFNILDHSAIYVLIAGTYTPFTLVVLGGGWGWSLFGVIWGLAAAGIVFKAVGRMQHSVLATTIYVMMGWLVIIAIKPLWHQLPMWGVVWLGAGGIVYTLGVAFFAAKGLRYSHLVWHLFVLAGTTCHFVAVLKYAT
ncbi:MAG: hemolysin III family protein [Candidatus Neomarinimicrobiota bacterium]